LVTVYTNISVNIYLVIKFEKEPLPPAWAIHEGDVIGLDKEHVCIMKKNKYMS